MKNIFSSRLSNDCEMKSYFAYYNYKVKDTKVVKKVYKAYQKNGYVFVTILYFNKLKQLVGRVLDYEKGNLV